MTIEELYFLNSTIDELQEIDNREEILKNLELMKKEYMDKFN